jgi:hypothetical protein
MNHLLRRIGLRLLAPAALQQIAARPDLSDAHRQGIAALLAHPMALRTLAQQGAEEMDGQPAGVAALEAAPLASTGTHPFLTWLMSGGGAWLYSVAVIVAAMFGIHLPPLPPLPPAP